MLLSLEKVSFNFGARSILENVSWQITEGRRIGLIGLNGAGKSTLFKLLSGEYNPTEGSINKAKETKIGFLNQDSLSFESSKSIVDVVKEAFEEAQKAWDIMQDLETKLETGDEKIIEQYHDAMHMYEISGGYESQYRSEEILEGLGFKTHELDQPFANFSGGWKMRVLLAKLILAQPQLLLLDEPTNHLDLPAIEWLEKYIQNYPGSIIIISHDREFLNQLCNELVEIDQRKLFFYKGNYEDYLSEKALRIEQIGKEYENQQSFIRQQERFIERFKAKASKATQAKSVQKKLDKIDRIELPTIDTKEMNLRFKLKRQSGKIVLELENISKSYPNKPLFDSTDAVIQKNDKIGLVGANGVGKTTLLQVIANETNFDGVHKWGYNVDTAFYAQHQIEALHMENDLMSEVASSNPEYTDLDVRRTLGCFLFSGDDVFKKVKVLSGGEKSRVALAKILINSANFLLLDEPTNHLDMISKDILIQALNDYEGSFVMVSHDREFLANTCNKIWEIIDGKIKEYPGTFNEWRLYKEKQNAQPTHDKKKSKEAAPVNPPKDTTNQKDRESLKAKNQLESQMVKLQKDIDDLKSKKETLLNALGDPKLYENQTLWKETETKFNNVSGELESTESKFENVFSQLLDME